MGKAGNSWRGCLMYMTITLLATTNRVIFVKLIIILKHKNIDRNNSSCHILLKSFTISYIFVL